MRTLNVGLLVGIACVANACTADTAGPDYVSQASTESLQLLGENARNFADNSIAHLYEVRAWNLPLFARGAGAAEGRRQFAESYLRRLAAASQLWTGAGDTPPAAPPAMAFPNQECEPLQRGADAPWYPTDADANGVADDWTVDYGAGCVNTDGTGKVTERFTGSYRIQQIFGFPYGFKITTDHLSVTYPGALGNGEDFTVSVVGWETFTMTPGLAKHLQRSVVGTTQVWGKEAEVVVEESSFVPDEGAVLARDAALPAGHFTYANDLGLVGYDAIGGRKDYRLVVTTPTPLRYDPACDSRYTGGVMRGLLNGRETVGFQATWNSCAAPTQTTFGGTP